MKLKYNEKYVDACSRLCVLQQNQHIVRLTLKILIANRNSTNKGIIDPLIVYYRKQLMINRKGTNGLRALNKITKNKWHNH